MTHVDTAAKDNIPGRYAKHHTRDARVAQKSCILPSSVGIGHKIHKTRLLADKVVTVTCEHIPVAHMKWLPDTSPKLHFKLLYQCQIFSQRTISPSSGL